MLIVCTAAQHLLLIMDTYLLKFRKNTNFTEKNNFWISSIVFELFTYLLMFETYFQIYHILRILYDVIST